MEVTKVKTEILSSQLKLSLKSKQVLEVIEKKENALHAGFEASIVKSILIELNQEKEQLVSRKRKLEGYLVFLNEASFVHSRLETSLNGSMFNTDINDNIKKDKASEIKFEIQNIARRILEIDLESTDFQNKLDRPKVFDREQYIKQVHDQWGESLKAHEALLKQMRKEELALTKWEAEEQAKDAQDKEMKRKEVMDNFEKIREEQLKKDKAYRDKRAKLEMEVKSMKDIKDFELNKKKVDTGVHPPVDLIKVKQQVKVEKRINLEKLEKRNEVYKIITNRELPGIPTKLKEEVTPQAVMERKKKLKEIQAAPLPFEKSKYYNEYEQNLELQAKDQYNKLYNYNKRRLKGQELKDSCLKNMERDESKIRELESNIRKYETKPFNKVSKEERENHFKRKVFNRHKLVKMTEEMAQRYKWKVDLAKSKESAAVHLEPIPVRRPRSVRTKAEQYEKSRQPHKFYESEDVPVKTETGVRPEMWLKHRRELRENMPKQEISLNGRFLKRKEQVGKTSQGKKLKV